MKFFLTNKLSMCITVLFLVFGSNAAPTPFLNAAMSHKEYDFRRTMDKLWVDHGAWTRSYIMEAINNGPGAQAAVDRLMKNQEDIGNAIASFYGKNAGNKLTQLLKDHIKIAADVVSAAKSNNQSKLTAANTQWHLNADDIARFLHEANPNNWQFKFMQDMLYDHLKLTSDEAVARIKSNWKADVDAFDKALVQLMDMSQTLASGIVNQFPAKFR